MPAEKRTILFGLITLFTIASKVLFFKPENFSPFLTTSHGYDASGHLFELGRSQYLKATSPGADEQPGMRKERVPNDAKEAFQELIKHLRNDIIRYRPMLNHLLLVDLDRTIEDANIWGISYMHRFVAHIEQQRASDLDQILSLLKKTWQSYDNLENRAGREVYINKKQLEDFAKDHSTLIPETKKISDFEQGVFIQGVSDERILREAFFAKTC